MPNPKVETVTVGQTTYDIHDKGAIADPGSGSAGKMLVYSASGPVWTPMPGAGVYSPVGTIIAYMGTTAPKDYLACDGTVYNIADYTLLANHIAAQFGSVDFFGGDGTTTFAVPDLRGEFLRGTGTNSHADQGSGDSVGVHQDATRHVSFTANPSLCYLYGYTYSDTSTSVAENSKAENVDSEVTGAGYVRAAQGNFSAHTNQRAGYTSRPTNTSVLYCIAYRDSMEDIVSAVLERLQGG